jgi:hypothetical protein
MARPSAFTISYTDDDSWRRHLCPDCGMRLFGLATWRDHAPRHRWGSEWLAARIRAARPGETVNLDPTLFADASGVEIHVVEDSSWRAGIEA